MGLIKELDVLQVFCEAGYKAKEITLMDYQKVKKSVTNIKNTLNMLERE